jgi:hypothetical protein
MTKPNMALAEPLDLDSLDTAKASDVGAEIELKHPTTKKPLGIFITVLGKHSEVFREIVRERTDERIAKAALSDQRGDEPELPTAARTEARAIELLVACTLGWRSGDNSTIFCGGEHLSFTVQNATTVYNRFIWIREQVDTAIGNLENFIKG